MDSISTIIGFGYETALILGGLTVARWICKTTLKNEFSLEVPKDKIDGH